MNVLRLAAFMILFLPFGSRPQSAPFDYDSYGPNSDCDSESYDYYQPNCDRRLVKFI